MARSTITGDPPERAPVVREPAQQLVVLGTCDDPSIASSRHLLHDIDEVHFARGERTSERVLRGGVRILELALPDPRMSSRHGRLIRGPSGWMLDDPASKNGAVIDGVVGRHAPITERTIFELGRTFFVLATGLTDGPRDAFAEPRATLTTFVPSLAERFRQLERIAPQAVSVVILGETGTGKEVVAQAIHERSRRPGAFVALNCGGLPAGLLESELFGYKKGAFSGATSDRIGHVRAADRGTLFLDEVGELPLGSQAAFLRVLQERKVIPIGTESAISVDIRLCAATLRDPQSLLRDGTFRPDLYARLRGFTIELPPLRERRADFGLLLHALSQRMARPVVLSPAAMRALLLYDWPLNIRELENTLATALALTDGVIEPEHLPEEILRAKPTVAGQDAESVADRELRDKLVELLTVNDGNVAAVAEAMGRQRTQVYRWIERFGIELERFRR